MTAQELIFAAKLYDGMKTSFLEDRGWEPHYHTPDGPVTWCKLEDSWAAINYTMAAALCLQLFSEGITNPDELSL